MNTALITGGLGFIGSNLVKVLLRKKKVSKCIILDSFSGFVNPIKETFIDLRKYRLERDVSYGNRKRIKNSINKGIQFSKLEKIDYFRAFKVIVDNRARRGFPLTMKWESLEEMISAFNDKLYFFGLQEKKEIIASAICINVFPNLLYVFYWGEISGYEKLSPIALLSNKLVEYCIKNNFEILDIGTSSERSNPNIGLLKFKKNIGCNTCNKFYLKKNL